MRVPLALTAVLLAAPSCGASIHGPWEGGLASYQDACEQGSAVACFNLGVKLDAGAEGVAKDPARAASLYRRACEAGSGPGCANLGAMLDKGEGVPRDEAQAAIILQRACDQGDGGGCHNLSRKVAAGRGVPADAARAAALARRACDLGQALDCEGLGEMTASGRGVPQDLAAAATFYRKACDLDSPVGCQKLGIMVAEGQGVPRDALQAMGLFRRALPRLEKACEAGAAAVCVRVGSMIDQGQGAPADPARALFLYRRACDTGVAGGCTAAGAKLETTDPTRGRAPLPQGLRRRLRPRLQRARRAPGPRQGRPRRPGAGRRSPGPGLRRGLRPRLPPPRRPGPRARRSRARAGPARARALPVTTHPRLLGCPPMPLASLRALYAALPSLEKANLVYEGPGRAKLTGAARVGPLLTLDMLVWSDLPEITPQRWSLRCLRPRAHRLTLNPVERLSLHHQHPLLWEHTEPSAELTFDGEPSDVHGLIGELWQAHLALAGGWIPFDRHVHTRALSSAKGELARGPERLLRAYEAVLARRSMKPSLRILEEKRWDGTEWKAISTKKDLELVLFDEWSYVVASSVEAARES